MSEPAAKTRAKGPPPSVQRAAAKAPAGKAAAPHGGLSGLMQRAGPALGLGVQRQVEVGQPGDRFEREADAAADRVSAGQSVEPAAMSPVTPESLAQTAAAPEKMPEAMPVQKAAAAPEKMPEATPVQKAAAAPEKTPEAMPVQKAAAAPEKMPEATPVQKAEAAPEKMPEATPVQKKDSGPEEQRDSGAVQKAQAPVTERTPVQTEAAGGGAPAPAASTAASDAIASKGAGKPLDPATRGTLEGGLGADLSDVRVHDDSAARASAQALDARAFTHGSDIWLGPGASQNDTRLMAHEATHVVQQAGGVHRMVQRANGKGGGASGGGAGKGASFKKKADKPDAYTTTLTLPQVKARFGSLYSAWASGDKLYRAAGYKRGNPNQKNGVWLQQVKTSHDALKRLGLDTPFTGEKVIEINNKKRGPYEYNKWLDLLRVPNWDRHGQEYSSPFEVDHMVELQTAGWPKNGGGNELSNMELLDKSANASSGGLIRSDIANNVSAFLATPAGQQSGAKSTSAFLAKNDVYFDKVQTGGAAGAKFENWTRDEIEQGLPVKGAEPILDVGKPGSATSFALLDPTKSYVLAEYPHKQKEKSFAISGAHQTKIGGLNATSLTLDAGHQTAAAGSSIGSMQVTWNLPKGITVPKTASTIPIAKAANGQFAGVLGKVPGLSADVVGASPLVFTDIGFDGNNISAVGTIKPTIPLLDKFSIEVHLLGSEIEFGVEYTPESISFKIPGIVIDGCSVGLFFNSKGLRAEGALDFSIPEAAQGSVSVKITSAGKFEAAGHLYFDPGLFDTACIEVWYRENNWGAAGTLAITKPGKIRGIRAASIKALLDSNHFTLSGSVDPDIPVVEQAGLSVDIDEKTGVTFIGDLALKKDTPGIDGGNIHVEARKSPDGTGYKVSAKGSAKPKIPGVDSELQVTYDDGTFDASVTAAYSRGRLSGSVMVGATNRPVTDGQPSGPAPEKAQDITVYGGGSLTITIGALQGTAAVHLLPNGEIEVAGEIDLTTNNFPPEKKFDKNIFTLHIDIPIFGITVPVVDTHIGIFATVEGGLDVNAGIGPGVLTGKLGIDYNPAHEENAKLWGGARLHVPANAGLRVFVSGGIGAGIPLVDATAKLTIGAGLGLEGALDTGVQIDWSPAKGLSLDADASVYVEPKLKVSVTGSVDVVFDTWVHTFHLYHHDWDLAAFEFGSNLRFGVCFPVHYDDSKGFDLSLDKVKFQVPDIKPKEILSDVISRIV